MTIDTMANSDATLVIERRFNVPIDVVWRAFTDPEMFATWWGPKGWDVPSITLDPVPGGVHRVEMREIDTGYRNTITGTYKTVEAPSRLVYSWRWSEGGLAGVETEVEITFTPDGSGTRMHMEHRGLGSVEWRDKHHHGWSGSLDRLAHTLDQG
ncbi:MAG: SRPBCC domain-containing protein [Alphaproteobacteria bacterium]|nr:SRPBCC domain-containing protein [Alphaproteobacteria bacterium]